MSDRPNRVEFVIQKYRLAETTNVEAEESGKRLGLGKIMADETFQHFLDSDPSGNFKYLDWLLFQAGGGQDAMDKSLALWNGQGDADPNSLRNQCRADFIEEQVKGFTDDQGYHAPVKRDVAEQAWTRIEERSKFEFLMGDQDVALEEGYGFYRYWPGKNKHYDKIVNAIKLWHMAQPKLLAQNQRYERWQRLKQQAPPLWTKDDEAFMRRCQDSAPPPLVDLDIYTGWKPKEYSQTGAAYKHMNDLLRVLADVRRMQILRDIRHEKIYEDERVTAICPLTIGASIKYGIGKWCTCNRTEFDRSFDARGMTTETNWQRYNRMGPLVFLSWKVPMPAWLHKVAIHITSANLTRLSGQWNDVNWIDCKNEQTATGYSSIRERIMNEHMDREPNQLVRLDMPAAGMESVSDERFYRWGGRKPGRAWGDQRTSTQVLGSFHAALDAIRRWAPTFDTGRVVLDYVTDIGSAVDKGDE